jgi:hypothetical protein
MKKFDAVDILTKNWAGCVDATGLLTALERIGVVKFDETESQKLLKRADSWTAAGSFVPVCPSTIREAVDLIRDLSDALRQTLDS